jgi:hypothetical protein
MTKAWIVVAALGATACRKDPAPTTPPPTPEKEKVATDGPPTCKAAVEHVATIVDKGPSEQEVTVVIDQCERMAWSAEIRSCLVDARTEEDLAACPQPDAGGDEPLVQMEEIAKAAGAASYMDGDFPVGTVGPTPATSCCDSGGTCDSAGGWTDPLWHQLEFSIVEPHGFRYAYQSKGGSFTVTAVGDLDCDGTEVTYTLTVTAPNGNPESTLTRPAPNSD